MRLTLRFWTQMPLKFWCMLDWKRRLRSKVFQSRFSNHPLVSLYLYLTDICHKQIIKECALVLFTLQSEGISRTLLDVIGRHWTPMDATGWTGRNSTQCLSTPFILAIHLARSKFKFRIIFTIYFRAKTSRLKLD